MIALVNHHPVVGAKFPLEFIPLPSRMPSTMLGCARFIGVGFAVCLSACAQPLATVNLRSVLDEAETNELGPTARLSKGCFAVQGVVERTGLKKQSEVSAEGSGSSGFGFSAKTSRIVDQFPFAVIAPPDGKPGRLMCFFEMKEIEEVAALKPSNQVTVYIQFERFERQHDHEVLVADCTLGH